MDLTKNVPPVPAEALGAEDLALTSSSSSVRDII
jgi:hypothetical protein